MAKPKRGRSTAAIDDHVGARIRERRIMLGLTQQQLAEMIGVTYQQAHKYERGINRVSAGRLYEIARVLNAPISDEAGTSGSRAGALSLHWLDVVISAAMRSATPSTRPRSGSPSFLPVGKRTTWKASSVRRGP